MSVAYTPGQRLLNCIVALLTPWITLSDFTTYRKEERRIRYVFAASLAH